MDKRAKYTVAWALARAQEQGYIPTNTVDNIYKSLSFTHPKDFTLDAKYDNAIILDSLNAGVSCLEDVTKKLYKRTAAETLEIQKQEQIQFYQKAQEVSAATGTDINTVIQGWRNQIKPSPTPVTQEPQTNE